MRSKVYRRALPSVASKRVRRPATASAGTWWASAKLSSTMAALGRRGSGTSCARPTRARVKEGEHEHVAALGAGLRGWRTPCCPC